MEWVKRIGGILALLAIALTIPLIFGGPKSKSHLKDRVTTFIRAQEFRDYRTMYKMLAPEKRVLTTAKQTREYTYEMYEKWVQKEGWRPPENMEYSIEEITIDNDIATVKVKYTSARSGYRDDTPRTYHWKFVNDDWYLNDPTS